MTIVLHKAILNTIIVQSLFQIVSIFIIDQKHCYERTHL